MNKKVLLLITLILLLITSLTYNLYKKSEKDLQSEFQRLNAFEQKAKEIKTLKNKYSTNALKYLKRICSVKQQNETYQIECNVSQKDLYKISTFLKSNVKLKSFSIKENKENLTFKAEILK